MVKCVTVRNGLIRMTVAKRLFGVNTVTEEKYLGKVYIAQDTFKKYLEDTKIRYCKKIS